MKNRSKRLLSLFLAFSVVATSPIPGLTAQAATSKTSTEATSLDNNDNKTDETTSPDNTNAIADDNADTGETAPEKPTLPEGFSNALEDSDGMTLAEGTTTKDMYGFGKVINVSSDWNNEGKFHASFKDAATQFKTTAFTVLMDVSLNPLAAGDSQNRSGILCIGNADNCIRLQPSCDKFGYGNSTTDGNGGVSTNTADMVGAIKDDWNAFALTYEEKDGGNGHVIVYMNGQKVTEVADIGFKLSSIDNLTATIARSFATSYMQTGLYDNIVVGNTVLDEATAIAETAYRKHAKQNPPIQPVAISIKGADVDAAVAKPNGLAYKGFGMLNGNSTSNLLLDYKAKHPDKYNEMMQYLFGGNYPLFTHIKMEMGNDGNNSTGAEACTMRYEDEEADVSRSPGFVMAADAKKINPNVKISILRWGMPNWVAEKWNNKATKETEGYEALYKWYKETVFDAYEKYGYVLDFINPDVNETGTPDENFIKWFSNKVKNETNFPDYMDAAAQAAYKNIRIIASDENKGLKIVPAMRADKDLYDAVDIIGFHYRTNATDDYIRMADEDDKEVWYSEGCATFGYSELQENKTASYGKGTIGGYQSPLALMDSFIAAFEGSRRTHYIFQPAVGSFYEGIQYGHKELISARDPWSGYIHYDPAVSMLEHFTKFAKTGWEDSNPETNDIWRVIKTSTKSSFTPSSNEHETSGANGDAGYMTLASPDKKDFSVVFVNNTKNKKIFNIKTEDMATTAETLNFWLTETDSYMKKQESITKTEDGWVVTLPAYSVATATTLTTDPDAAPVDRNGDTIRNAERAVLDTNADGGTNGVTNDKVLYADNFEYKEEAADFLEKRGYEPRYMLDTHGAWIVDKEKGALKQELTASVSQWNGGDPSTIVGDFRWMDYMTSIDIEIPDADKDVYARLTVRSQTGMNWGDSGYTLSINGAGNWELYRIGTKVSSGKVAATADGKYNVKIMALGDTISVAINNESVTSYKDTVPMLAGRVKLSSSWDQVYFDNLLVETIEGGIPYALSMVDGQDDSVTYEGTWTIDNPGGGSANDWYRTLSVTNSENASFSFPINGSGFAVLGPNDGTAVLDVYVNDTLVAENATTVASPSRGETYSLSDLEAKEHNIKIVVKSGTLKVDALYALGTRTAVTNADALVSVDTSALPKIPAMLPGTPIENLPETLEITTAGGTTVTKNVTWNTSAEQFEGKDFQQVSIIGTVQDGVTAMGLPMIVTVPVEIVVPADTLYFIDPVVGGSNLSEVSTTEPYEAVKDILGDKLLNQAYDQIKADSNTWGRIDKDAGTRDYNDDTTDMTATGIYAAKNEKGETLSYAFTLPAGTYKLLSAHREWWSQNRPMSTKIIMGDTQKDAGTINLNGSSGDILNATSFTLESEQLVTYELTATGSQAPVISWLAVMKHEHNYTNYKDNGDGTHTVSCSCNDSRTEDHTYDANDICTGCGVQTIKTAQVTLADGDSYSYTGTAIEPKVTVVLKDKTLTEKDYTVTYKNNTNAGTATITVTGKGKYTGTVTKDFTIETVDLKDAAITLKDGDTYTYTGKEIKPAVTVVLKDQTLTTDDYTVTYEKNIEVGTATVTVTGKGNYKGTVTKNFTIKAAPVTTEDIKAATITLAGGDTHTYTGKEIKPAVTVKLGTKTLTKDTDYTVTYKNNTAVGTATVTVTGKGKYTGTATKNFTIKAATTPVVAKDLKDAVLTLSQTSYVYDGKKKTPAVTVKLGTKTLKKDTDYTVAYTNNINAGTATVTVKAKGTAYKGTKTITFKITKKDIKKAVITLKTTKYTYNGKQKKPAVTKVTLDKVKLTTKNYSIAYSNNVNAGTAKVTITGKGNYTGKATKNFTINKASAKITLKSTSLKKALGSKNFTFGASVNSKGKLTYTSSNKKVIKIDKSKGKVVAIGEATITVKAAATKNYKATSKKLKVTVTPKKATLSTVSSKKAGQLSIKWKKDSKASGYMIQYSTSKKFTKKTTKTQTIKSNKTTSYTKKKLAKGKTYYVRVCAYKKVNKKNICGAYSAVKKVKIKK